MARPTFHEEHSQNATAAHAHASTMHKVPSFMLAGTVIEPKLLDADVRSRCKLAGGVSGSSYVDGSVLSSIWRTGAEDHLLGFKYVGTWLIVSDHARFDIDTKESGLLVLANLFRTHERHRGRHGRRGVEPRLKDQDDKLWTAGKQDFEDLISDLVVKLT